MTVYVVYYLYPIRTNTWAGKGTLFLPGAVDGIVYYLNLQWEKLLDMAVSRLCFGSAGCE